MKFASRNGQVVVVSSVHQSRCDALVLPGPGNVAHIPLPDFSFGHAKALQTLLWEFLTKADLLRRWRRETLEELEEEDRGIKPSRRARHLSLDGLMRGMLSMLWLKVVKPITDVVRTLVPVSFLSILSSRAMFSNPLISAFNRRHEQRSSPYYMVPHWPSCFPPSPRRRSVSW